MRKALALFGGLFILLGHAGLFAGEADVTAVAVEKTAERTFTFHATLSHHDEGWNHFANKWDVVAPDGTVLGTRKLHHPHIDEQPFTRSLSGVKIPDGIDVVTIRAHDAVHAYGGKTIQVTLPHSGD